MTKTTRWLDLAIKSAQQQLEPEEALEFAMLSDDDDIKVYIQQMKAAVEPTYITLREPNPSVEFVLIWTLILGVLLLAVLGW
jgi:hypothetical protein